QVAVAWGAWPQEVRLVGVTNVERDAIALRIHRDRRDLHLATGPDDPNSDLAAVGNEDLVHVKRWLRQLTILAPGLRDVRSGGGLDPPLCLGPRGAGAKKTPDPPR